MRKELRRKWYWLAKHMLVAAVAVFVFVGFGTGTALADTGSMVRVVTDLSTYSSNVEITWDAPSDFAAREYVIYVDGSERYRTSENRYTFTDMAPDTSYVVTVRPTDEAGFLYPVSNPAVIRTTYNKKLLVSASGQNTDSHEADTVYADIQAAVNEAKPGDVIVVKDGYYTGAISIGAKQSGTAGQWITLRAENSAAWLFGTISLQASYYRIEGLKTYLMREVASASELRPNEAGYEILEYEEKKYLMFDAKAVRTGIVVKGNNTQVVRIEVNSATSEGFVIAGERNYVGHNVFHNCTGGGNINGTGILFDENEISGIAAYAFLMPHGDIDVMRVFGFDNIVRNNYIHELYKENIGNSHVDFIQIYDNNREVTRNLLIEGNYVDCFLHQGVFLESDAYKGEYLVSDITIRNNIIKGFLAWGVCSYSSKDIVVENNLFIGGGNGGNYGSFVRLEGSQGIHRNNIYYNVKAAYGAMDGGFLTDSGNNLMLKGAVREGDINADPMFVDPDNGDYHLLPGSPAIDAGRMSAFIDANAADESRKSGVDLDGNARVSGSSIDIGPYEYQQKYDISGIQTLLFTNDMLAIGVGDTVSTGVTLYPTSATNKNVTYESSDDSIARITQSGEVIGVGAGTAILTVRAATGACDTCKVTVSHLPGFREFTVDPDVVAFQSDVFEYNADVPYDTQSITVTPSWVNGSVSINGATVAASGVPVPVTLNVGDNAILITYQPNSGAKVTYQVNLNRSGIRYYNAKEGYSDTQGKNQWYYYRITGDGKLLELTWSKIKGMWTMADSMYRPWIQSDRQHTQKKGDASVRAWKAPVDGTVVITGETVISGRGPYDIGSNVTIKKNDEVLWTKHVYITESQFSHILAVNVKCGDMIYFQEDPNGADANHNIRWNPTIALSMVEGQEVPFPGDVNGDRAVDTIDLAFIAKHIDKTSDSRDWAEIKQADLNGDGKIDILDLASVAKLL